MNFKSTISALFFFAMSRASLTGILVIASLSQ